MKKIMVFGALMFALISTESCRTTVVEKPAPPAVVVKPPQPRPNYIWIDGEWYRAGGRYQYRQGYWAPPRGGRTWIPGHWVQAGHGWYWQKGHWR